MRHAHRRLTAAALALALIVVSLGAWVRLSDAGLGCPDWPGCYGHLVGVPDQAHEIAAAQAAFPGKHVETPKAWKEMIHRYAAGGLGLVIAALAVLAWRQRARRSPWLELGLLASAALAVVVVQIALGGWVSSNYAAAICADFPTCQGSWWPAMDAHHAFTVDRELGATASGALLPAAALTAIHWAHRLFAGVVLVVVGSFGLKLLGQRRLSGHGLVLLAALAAQISLGIANVLLQLPLPLAVAHNTGAALLLCAVLVACAQVFQSKEARGQVPAAGFPRRFEAAR